MEMEEDNNGREDNNGQFALPRADDMEAAIQHIASSNYDTRNDSNDELGDHWRGMNVNLVMVVTMQPLSEIVLQKLAYYLLLLHNWILRERHP